MLYAYIVHTHTHTPQTNKQTIKQPQQNLHTPPPPPANKKRANKKRDPERGAAGGFLKLKKRDPGPDPGLRRALQGMPAPTAPKRSEIYTILMPETQKRSEIPTIPAPKAPKRSEILTCIAPEAAFSYTHYYGAEGTDTFNSYAGGQEGKEIDIALKASLGQPFFLKFMD